MPIGLVRGTNTGRNWADVRVSADGNGIGLPATCLPHRRNCKAISQCDGKPFSRSDYFSTLLRDAITGRARYAAVIALMQNADRTR